jgi:hypothetical protein
MRKEEMEFIFIQRGDKLTENSWPSGVQLHHHVEGGVLTSDD